ncbi:MAG: septum formation initiator family protein [Candidatus Omnitrophica bacterium]|nr:septum formation initiator family protein [Candidatus Omnitrophota bacterium]
MASSGGSKPGRLKLYIVIGIVTVLFLPPFAKYQALRYKSKKIDERIAQLKVENKRLEEERLKLLTDTAYIEKRAREKVGMVRKGEIVMKESPPKKR